jgi:hypothetical protein
LFGSPSGPEAVIASCQEGHACTGTATAKKPASTSNPNNTLIHFMTFVLAVLFYTN